MNHWMFEFSRVLSLTTIPKLNPAMNGILFNLAGGQRSL